MTVALFVVTLVLGIALVLILVATPFVVVFRRRYRQAATELNSTLEHETILIPLSKGVYRGSTAPGYPNVKNNGRMALTRSRLVFLTLTGKTVEIPLSTITGLAQSPSFKGSIAGGWVHLIVRTSDGETGFYTSDNAVWLRALGEATGVTPDA